MIVVGNSQRPLPCGVLTQVLLRAEPEFVRNVENGHAQPGAFCVELRGQRGFCTAGGDQHHVQVSKRVVVKVGVNLDVLDEIHTGVQGDAAGYNSADIGRRCIGDRQADVS